MSKWSVGYVKGNPDTNPATKSPTCNPSSLKNVPGEWCTELMGVSNQYFSSEDIYYNVILKIVIYLKFLYILQKNRIGKIAENHNKSIKLVN